MTVHELNREEILQLKQEMLTDRYDDVSWGEFDAADEIFSNAEVYEEYDGVTFEKDDFWCNI